MYSFPVNLFISFFDEGFIVSGFILNISVSESDEFDFDLGEIFFSWLDDFFFLFVVCSRKVSKFNFFFFFPR